MYLAIAHRTNAKREIWKHLIIVMSLGGYGQGDLLFDKLLSSHLEEMIRWEGIALSGNEFANAAMDVDFLSFHAPC